MRGQSWINRRTRTSAGGFTLIEVLLALSLLASGLVLAFAVIRSAQAVSGRGEAIATQSEQIRAVEGFLRRRLAGSLPVAFDGGRGRPASTFVGEADRMLFVADLPAYLGQGGPYLHELYLGRKDNQRQLQLKFSFIQNGKVVANGDTRAPDVLADGVRIARFRYRGMDASGHLGDWEARWSYPQRLPLQVEIVIEPKEGTPWPPLVVSLPQGNAFGVAR